MKIYLDNLKSKKIQPSSLYPAASVNREYVRKNSWKKTVIRSDIPSLLHWTKNDAELNDYAKFNQKMEDFTQVEGVPSDGWSKEEDEYLIKLCTALDLRFPIIHDRYEFNRERTIEQLKARYYTLKGINYPMEQEVKRKEYVNKLIDRDTDAWNTELELNRQLRVLQQNIKRLDRERDDLLTVNNAAPATGATLIDILHKHSVSSSTDKIKKIKKPPPQQPKKKPVTLRSASITQIKPKLYPLFEEFHIPYELSVSTEKTVKLYNELIQEVSDLYELRRKNAQE